MRRGINNATIKNKSMGEYNNMFRQSKETYSEEKVETIVNLFYNYNTLVNLNRYYKQYIRWARAHHKLFFVKTYNIFNNSI